MSRVVAEVEVRPSEVEDRVIIALNNLFSYEKMSREIRELGYVLVASSESLGSLVKLHRLLMEQRILDSARKHLFKGAGVNVVTFMVNKQAAYRGIVAFSDSYSESPLGPIKFTVHTKNPRDFIDWLAPKTARGKPLWEKPVPVE
jgi:predicted RNA binding protein with dsRBD fold (UPF0201 family)